MEKLPRRASGCRGHLGRSFHRTTGAAIETGRSVRVSVGAEVAPRENCVWVRLTPEVARVDGDSIIVAMAAVVMTQREEGASCGLQYESLVKTLCHGKVMAWQRSK